MRTLRFVAAEAWYEFRAGCRGPLIPIVFLGIIAYIMLVLTNAEYLREYGSIDVQRNSPQLVYLMIAGQAMWVLFVWAWLFGQIVVRDRNARLHEVVLSAPVSLPALLAGRYLGAVATGCVLALSMVLAFLLVPLLGALGVVPPDAVGPQPYFAMGHALLVFVVPSTFGLGALLLCAAIRARGMAGPFAVAAALMLVWMVAIVILRGGDANPAVATLLDASGFSEVEEQTDLWTPQEKRTGVIEMTTPLVVNRVIWTVPPLLLLAFVLQRLGRERLALEPAPAASKPDRAATDPEVESARSAALPGIPARPSWVRATWDEAVWHFSLAFRGWGTLLAVGLIAVMGVGSSFVHIVMHADGPLVPRPDLIQPLMGEMYYLMLVFIVAAFVGVMVRRDDRPGYGEIADATPAPLGTRVAGRSLAAAALTIVFTLTPVVAVWIVPALAVPDSFSLLDPLVYFGVAFAPSLLELCAVVLLAHALLRHAGTAHAVAMICAFAMVLNHDIEVVSYPPANVGVPPHVALSEFTGWAPWLGYVVTANLFKVALAAAIVALAWIAWPRGTALTAPLRLRAGMRRFAGAAGALAAVAVVLAAGVHGVLHEQLVTLGGYRSATAETADDAAWEARWWADAAPFTLTGGEAHVVVDPAARRATARWRLDGVRSALATLHGSLPHGAADPRATLDGREAQVTVAFDHFSVPLGECGAETRAAVSDAEPAGAQGCTVELEVEVRGEGWSAEGETPWLHPSGVWLRAADLLPTLGHDADRVLRAPPERRDHGLAAAAAAAAPAALAPASGVAPAGDWRWTVSFAGGHGNGSENAGSATATEGRTQGPLDFAAVWWPDAPLETRRGGLAALHGPTRTRDAGGVLTDVSQMRACVTAVLGAAPRIAAVVQAPRERGETALHGDLLWLPEDAGWDIAGAGFGGWNRRATIAAAIARAHVTTESGLRKEPGAEWLRVGVPGWVGLECVRREHGIDASLALLTRSGSRVSEAFGALGAPAASVAAAGDTTWVQEYTPLATAGWVETLGPGQAAGVVRAVVAGVRAGRTLASALVGAAGADMAEALLGAPASSDVLVARDERTLNVAGRRWRWRDGGWEPLAAAIHVTQRFDDGSGGRRRIGPVPTTADPDAPFTLMDAWPSFERTPADNVWRGDGDN